MGGSGGGGNSTTTTKADPWIGVQPYLQSGYQQLSNLYQPGMGPQYFPGQTVANPSQTEQLGNAQMLDQYRDMTNLANVGSNSLQIMGDQSAQAAQTGKVNSNIGISGQQGLAQTLNQGGDNARVALSELMRYGGGGVTNQGTNALVQAMNRMGVTGGMNSAAGGMATNDAMQQLNQAGDPANNPYFQSAVQSAIRPVTQQFQEQVMPGIKQGAQSAGQMGGSRQGIAEGIASRGYMDTVGDITSNMGNAAYGQGLQALQASGQLGQGMAGLGLQAQQSSGQLGQNLAGMGLGATSGAGALGAQLAGLQGNLYGNIASQGIQQQGQGLTALGQSTALTPAAIQAQMMPGQMTQSIGQQQTADQQAQINAEMQKYNYGQNLPYAMIQDYLNSLNGGASLGGSQVAQQSGAGGNRATGALGGAASGAAIGSAFGPGYGTAIGAGLGAMYGLFA